MNKKLSYGTTAQKKMEIWMYNECDSLTSRHKGNQD